MVKRHRSYIVDVVIADERTTAVALFIYLAILLHSLPFVLMMLAPVGGKRLSTRLDHDSGALTALLKHVSVPMALLRWLFFCHVEAVLSDRLLL